ncbi:ATP-binding protein [Acinetobacter wuhouensis]|uniref:ATP-binding protein n=1 Tax=Acinetobacter wuhouensis TaxID=1879050 RepID=A0A4Q7ALP2_9GAMM|nr:AAA family ATPase [Acinetobacter wuhouensis]RZG47311.1 ATP-binding protein [Acinetobacter wuhouensis]
MKLEAIQFRHTYHFADLKINFDYKNKPITLIVGDQASGKTAIIKNMYQALTWFPARLKDLRTPGVVMSDQDIMADRVQSKIDVQISFPTEIGKLPESETTAEKDLNRCDWQLYKTLNSSGVGISKVELQQLEQVVGLYNQAIKNDPIQGFPLIAYYPAERFVNEINVLSKNNPAVLYPHNAYELVPIPYTTFARFFEWFREICDIENAQTAQLFQTILAQKQEPTSVESLQNILFHARSQLHAPSLQALKKALNIVIPEVTDILLEYQPKLQLMVTYKNQSFCYQQLSNTVKNWIGLVGDLVRRMCLLNPLSLFPCEEGDGILLIDQIDVDLDQFGLQLILERLNQAFPRLQIIATASHEELLDQADEYQCFKLENKQLYEVKANSTWLEYQDIYENLLKNSAETSEQELLEPSMQMVNVQKLFQQYQHLSKEQQSELRQLIQSGDDTSSQESLL